MPAGLDGNLNPVVSVERSAVLRLVADRVARLPGDRVLVAVDGASSTGKSTFADELARAVGNSRRVVRSSIDSFHRPRHERYRLGADSPVGYYRDSHDLHGLRRHLLDPFAARAASVRTALFDEPCDRPVDEPAIEVPAGAILIFDGLFLHRPELVDVWSLSVFLVADERREAAWQAYLTGSLPDDPAERADEIAARARRARRPRYVEGQAIYEAEARPREHATFVIDNDDLARPQLLTGRHAP